MKKIKVLFKSHYKFILIFVALGFFVSIFNIIGISTKVINIITLVMESLISLHIGYKFGKSSKRKAIIEGLYIGSKICLLLIILGLIFYGLAIKLMSLILYLIMIGSCIIGAIFGKNKAMK